MKLVVTGASGQVTLALQEGAKAAGCEVILLSRPEFELADATNAKALLEQHRPDVVISAGAYTAVDLAESHADEAMAVNATGPGRLSASAAELGLPVLHLSTDYVFAGDKATPYRETDPTGPSGVYGATKLAGEQAVAAANPRHVILRTAWVYAHEGKNFVKTMLKLAETRPQLGVVSDQFGCPTYATDIASALFAIARQVVGKAPGDACFGTFHLAGAGDTSWAGFASAIFALARQQGAPAAAVNPIATQDYPTPAKRPANSRLDCARLREVFDITLPHWHDGLTRCMTRLLAAAH